MNLSIALPTLFFATLAVAADIPSPDVQIAGAVLAAPADLRESATVIGYNPQGVQVRIREGKGDLVCLATDPKKPTFNVACYHKDLEPFMARGRELLSQNVTGAKRTEMRSKEIEDGKLKMPKDPRTLYVLTGKSFDAATLAKACRKSWSRTSSSCAALRIARPSAKQRCPVGGGYTTTFTATGITGQGHSAGEPNIRLSGTVSPWSTSILLTMVRSNSSRMTDCEI